MGGAIRVSSEPGRGSVFEFTVRVRADASAAGVGAAATGRSLAGRQLLVAASGAVTRRMVAALVQRWGASVTCVETFADALAAVQSTRVDAAIVDVEARDASGDRFAERLVQQLAGRGIERVLLQPLRVAGEGTLEPLTHRNSTSRVEFQMGRANVAEPRRPRRCVSGAEGPLDLGRAVAVTRPVKAGPLHDALTGLWSAECNQQGERAENRLLGATPPAHRPLRILLADDNLVNQKVALKMLERLGYRADVAANGIEVLEALRRQPYDVVLLDVLMPEMDGLETARRIRADMADGPRPHVIGMTALALQGDRERCLAAGMDDYVAKPVDPQALRRALDHAPVGARAEPGAATAAPAVDLAALGRLRELQGDEETDFVTELIDGFLRDIPGRLVQLEELVSAGDAPRTFRVAHTMKSSCAHLGARTMADLCATIESAARHGRLEGLAAVVDALLREFDRVVPALEAERRPGTLARSGTVAGG